MKSAVISSDQILTSGFRLDAQPYVGDGLEARRQLSRLDARLAELEDLALGGAQGVFNGPRFPRIYVDDPSNGVPFLGSTDILAADVSGLALISRATLERFPKLQIREGYTLITCSGTIGRMAYARREMDGMVGSQHFLRVVPDPELVRPGYLFAFLSSKYGVPQVVSETYGAIIRHIEPSHILSVRVPIATGRMQEETHRLVSRAGELRSAASELFRSAVRQLEAVTPIAGLGGDASKGRYACYSVSSECLKDRFDAVYHRPFHSAIRAALRAQLPYGARRIVDVATRVFEPSRFRRERLVGDSAGRAFFQTATLFHSDPRPSYYIGGSDEDLKDYEVTSKMVLVPRSGQVQGILGESIMPHSGLLGACVSEDAIRIDAPSDAAAGFIAVALSSQHGREQMKSAAFGSSIPHLNCAVVADVLIPWPGQQQVDELGRLGVAVSQMRSEATALERAARTAVEEWIQGSGVPSPLE